MRIVVDLQACQTPDSRQRGIGRYSLDLAKAFLRNRGPHEVAFVANRAFSAHDAGLAAELAQCGGTGTIDHYALVPLAGAPSATRRGLQRVNDALLNWQYACARPDLIHVSSVFEGWVSGDAHVARNPTEVPGALCSATLYDLIPLIFDDVYLSREVRPDYFAKLGVFSQLDVVLAISESARQDAISRLGLAPERVTNIRGATSARFRHIADLDPSRARAVLMRHGLDTRFLLYTSGIDHRKNNHALIDAYALLPPALREKVQLAIVCAVLPEQRAELLRHAARRGVAPDRIRLTGYVDDDDLNLLYNLCEVFVFPSLYEGFGLPLLEAMTCGACTAASNASSLPEIAGRPDVLFDPRRPESIAGLLAKLLESPNLRSEISAFNLARATEFSWDRCARDAIAAFEAADERRSTARSVRAGSPRPRLALFSPIPPQRSGIADYTAALLPHLSEHYEVDLVVDDGVQAPGDVPGAYRTIGYRDFPPRAARYDAVLYHFGNSEFHRYMYDVAAAYPGVVVLHDFFLSGLIHWMDSTRHAPGLLAEEIVRSHGAAGTQALAAMARGELALHDLIYDFPMSRAILEAARGVIFHSRFASGLLGRFFPDLDSLPVRIVPHFAQPAPPGEDERQDARRALGLDPDDVLVCAFGFIAETKQNHLLLEALALPALADERRLRVAFVGELPKGEYRDRVRALIRASPHRGRIEITGWASEEVYRRHLAATDIAVSLRERSRGETSGAVLKNLAAGRATIVTDDATMAELPDGTVRKIAPGSAEAVCRELRALIDDPHRRSELGRAALRHVEADLGPTATAQRYACAITELMAASAAQSASRVCRRVAEEIVDQALPHTTAAAAATAIRSALLRRPHLARELPFASHRAG